MLEDGMRQAKGIIYTITPSEAVLAIAAMSLLRPADIEPDQYIYAELRTSAKRVGGQGDKGRIVLATARRSGENRGLQPRRK